MRLLLLATPRISQLPKEDRLPGGARINDQMRARSVSEGRWKDVGWNGGSEALFDLKADPHQMKNLAANPEHAATPAANKKLLANFADDTHLPSSNDDHSSETTYIIS